MQSAGTRLRRATETTRNDSNAGRKGNRPNGVMGRGGADGRMSIRWLVEAGEPFRVTGVKLRLLNFQPSAHAQDASLVDLLVIVIRGGVARGQASSCLNCR